MALGLQAILGTMFVQLSVVVINITGAKKPEGTLTAEDTAEAVGS